MSPKVIDDLQAAIDEHGNEPVKLVDRATKAEYVILPAELYERVKALIGTEEDFKPRELYPLVEQAFRRAGWDDPAMDEYNDYDAHRPKP
jgi:hypothetical protein